MTPRPTLREAQQWMAEVIVDPSRLATVASAANGIAVPAGTNVEERLHIYADGYPARVHEALEEAFPAIAHVVGAGPFSALTQRYAAAVPLHSYNLSDAGARLPTLLVGDELTSNLPFLPDLARLEWHVARAFHAMEEGTFDPASVAQWSLEDWDRAVLRFQPSVAVVESEWPIREIWECSDTPVDQIDIDLRGRPDWVLVRRAGLAVVCESLDDAEACALRLLLDGQSLGSAVAAVGDRGDDPASVSTWFARWVSLRMIVSCAG